MNDTTTARRDPLRNDRLAVITYLANLPLRVSFTLCDTIDGMIHRNYLMVTDAPATVTREIIGNFVMVDLTPRGLRIPLTPLDSD